jgi:CubicO group peptidase (beta-lactamase class C family)
MRSVSLLLLELSVSALSWHHGMTESLVMPFPAEKFGHGIMDLGDYAPGDPIPTSFTGVVEAQVQGKTIRHEGHGLANKVFNVPMPTGATFRIGSNSKLFVTVALYQLQEQGLINISKPVSSYLDAADFAKFGHKNVSTWCPRVYNKPDGPCTSPTVEQLLSMGSGIVDVTNCDYPEGSPFLQYCWRDDKENTFKKPFLQLVDGEYGGDMATVIGNFILNPLSETPGSAYHYTNSNFVLASYLVEKYTNMGLGEYLHEHVFKPLQLNATYLDNLGPQYSMSNYPQLANEYVDFFDHSQNGAYIDSGIAPIEFSPGSVSGAGGMFSTTNDMLAWYSALFNPAMQTDPTVKNVLSLESVKDIMRPRMQVNPADPNTFYAQGTVVQLYDKTSGWPGIIIYEGGCFNAWTSIVYSPGIAPAYPKQIGVAVFSTVAQVNVTSAAAYHAIATKRVGSYADLIGAIALGQNDGGAGATASRIFLELAKSGAK